MNLDDVAQFSAQYIGCASSVLTLILGIVHAANKRPTIDWPDDDFLRDTQAATWRSDAFTLKPDPFVDLWTPLLFGVIGILAHTSQSTVCKRITSSYLTYFVWLFLQMLFANLGYRGGFGILVGIVSGLAAFMALSATALAGDRNGSAAIKNGFGVDI